VWAFISTRGFPIRFSGVENLPPHQDSALFLTPHILHVDVATYLLSAMRARRKVVSPLAGIESFSKTWDRLQIYLCDCVTTMRHRQTESASDTATINSHRLHSADVAVQRLLDHRDLMIWPEGTLCPEFDSMLQVWNGWYAIARRALDQGAHVRLIPTVAALVPKEDYSVERAFVEFCEPFDIEGYATPTSASTALREYLLAKKRAINEKYNPGMTAEQWSRMRDVQRIKRPTLPDYQGVGAVFSLDYHLAEKSEDPAAMQGIIDRFRS